MTRTRNFTIAAALQVLLSIYTIVAAIPLLATGQAAVDQSQDSPPFFIIVLAFSVALIGLVSAYGVWKVQKWGVILTIVLRTIDALSAAPGVIFAPTQGLFLSAIVGITLSVVVIALLLWPQPKAARPSAAQGN